LGCVEFGGRMGFSQLPLHGSPFGLLPAVIQNPGCSGYRAPWTLEAFPAYLNAALEVGVQFPFGI
jgi:hypothetical protein